MAAGVADLVVHHRINRAPGEPVRQLRPVLDRAGWMPHYGPRSNQVMRMEFEPGGRRRRPVRPRLK